MENDQAQIIITIDRESQRAGYQLVGLSHQEAEVILLEIARDNLQHAMAKLSGHHHHDEDGHHDH